MSNTQKWLLGSGALLLVLTNVVALLGVAYNRMSPPDSVMTLTEREFAPQWSWMWREGENSGRSVQLQLRAEIAQGTRPGLGQLTDSFAPYRAVEWVRWLDQDKLTALGFDLNVKPSAPEASRLYEHMLEREVLLVLELDGPTRSRALQSARDRVSHLEQAAENSDEKGATQQLEHAQQDLGSEEQTQSRLFIVDAGLDEASLRQKYSDRSHYAIVHGAVRPTLMRDSMSAAIYGRVIAVHCESIHVPLQFQALVPAVERFRVGLTVVPVARLSPLEVRPFTLRVAFGRRLEPWIDGAR